VTKDEMQEIASGVATANCPTCNGEGYTVEPRHATTCDGSCSRGECPVPEQCPCWCELEKMTAVMLMAHDAGWNARGLGDLEILESLMNRSPVYRGLTIPEQNANEALGSAINRIRALKKGSPR
jgi:hypothetical protein